MDAYQVASTLIVIIAATAWLLDAQATNRDAAADETPWRILATTLNCAEQSSVKALLGEEQAGSLEKLLRRGYIHVAVRVRLLGGLRRTVEAHLGSAYSLVSYEKIGEKRVRGRIAVAVFARKCDVDDGRVGRSHNEKNAHGRRVHGQRRVDEGGVAIEVRVGARVRVIGAHLPADAGRPRAARSAERLRGGPLRWR